MYEWKPAYEHNSFLNANILAKISIYIYIKSTYNNKTLLYKRDHKKYVAIIIISAAFRAASCDDREAVGRAAAWPGGRAATSVQHVRLHPLPPPHGGRVPWQRHRGDQPLQP